MTATYRNCMVCGKRFKICNTCLKSMPEELQWRRVVCCSQHFAYHLPIIRYVRKEISRDNAKAELQHAITTFGEIEFAENIKSVVNEILAD